MAKVSKAAFTKALMARTKGVWAEARKAEGKASRLTAPDGDYIARLRAVTYSIDKNGSPYFQFRMYLLSDEQDINGQPAFKGHFLTPPKPKVKGQTWEPKTIKDKMEKLAIDFKALEQEGDDIRVEDIDESELSTLADKFTEEKPLVKIHIARFDDPKTGKPDPLREPFIFINGIIDEDDALVPQVDEAEYEDDEEDDDEDEAEVADERDELPATTKSMKAAKKAAPIDDEEYEDEETPAPKTKTKAKAKAKAAPVDEDDAELTDEEPIKHEKGDTVNFAARTGGKKEKCLITAVGRDGTLTLKRESDDRVFKGIDPEMI